MSETRVTGDGLTVFLHTHPNATHVAHEDSILAFRRLPREKRSALSKLSCSDCSVIGDDLLEAAVANCSRVEAVSLTNAASPGIGNESLYRLMTMKNLLELHLGNYAWSIHLGIPFQVESRLLRLASNAAATPGATHATDYVQSNGALVLGLLPARRHMPSASEVDSG